MVLDRERRDIFLGGEKFSKNFLGCGCPRCDCFIERIKSADKFVAHGDEPPLALFIEMNSYNTAFVISWRPCLVRAILTVSGFAQIV